jgi:hypothetical protein
MRNKLTPAQRRQSWIYLFILLVLAGIVLVTADNPNPLVPGVASAAMWIWLLVMWIWNGLRIAPDDHDELRKLLWLGIGASVVGVGMILWWWIGDTGNFLLWSAFSMLTIGVGSLIAGGYRLWQARQRAIR